MYNPTWNEVFKRLSPDPRDMNAPQERRAVDSMIDEKEREFRQNPKARQWEADRKAEWKRYGKQKRELEKTRQQKIDHARRIIDQAIKDRQERQERLERDKSR